jgi:hypothetical protein
MMTILDYVQRRTRRQLSTLISRWMEELEADMGVKERTARTMPRNTNRRAIFEKIRMSLAIVVVAYICVTHKPFTNVFR